MDPDFERMVPQDNSQAHSLIYVIETLLREFLIDCLSLSENPKAYTEILPSGRITDTYRTAKQYERQTPWVQCVPSHPIYYLEFSDLPQIIEKRTNWPNTLGRFCDRKDILVSSLKKIEPVRNKIAHNRKATINDVIMAESLMRELTSTLGKEYALQLLSRQNCALGVSDILSEMILEATSARDCIREYKQAKPLVTWPKARESWWYDEDYLGHPINPIDLFFSTVEKFGIESWGRGSSYLVDRWLATQEFEDKYTQCILTIRSLLENHSHER